MVQGSAVLTHGQNAVGIARVCAILQIARFAVGIVQSAEKKKKTGRRQTCSEFPAAQVRPLGR